MQVTCALHNFILDQRNKDDDLPPGNDDNDDNDGNDPEDPLGSSEEEEFEEEEEERPRRARGRRAMATREKLMLDHF